MMTFPAVRRGATTLAAALLRGRAGAATAFADTTPSPSATPSPSTSTSPSPSATPTPQTKVDQDRAALANGSQQFSDMMQKTAKLRAASTQALAKIDSDLAL